MNIPSERIENINPNHAMVLPHDANPKPDGIFGKDSQPMVRLAAALIMFVSTVLVGCGHSNAFRRSHPTSTPPIRKK
jgi:hypothetical protein